MADCTHRMLMLQTRNVLRSLVSAPSITAFELHLLHRVRFYSSPACVSACPGYARLAALGACQASPPHAQLLTAGVYNFECQSLPVPVLYCKPTHRAKPSPFQQACVLSRRRLPQWLRSSTRHSCCAAPEPATATHPHLRAPRARRALAAQGPIPRCIFNRAGLALSWPSWHPPGAAPAKTEIGGRVRAFGVGNVCESRIISCRIAVSPSISRRGSCSVFLSCLCIALSRS
ncbi:hypothetical protein BU23DRAFT_560801 [Bimuria novae-zelandiae CBS 107.79]|uniref:Uncharacterized protein n=1 Tax=Bimuria novae-zelandiae CBS 107.79 TaxID=1447943 RepID=A0A6A5UPA8_9PLEO|nr:hypothetical protein BU23DRAFT_560801 [Bimuria novae-zelandiae CBS 107.79]